MIKRKDDIKAAFKKNCIPTEANFADMIDSGINQMDDGLKKSAGDPLTIIAGGETQEVFSFYKSFDAKKPSWNVNLNPSGGNPGFNFYTPNGASRLFINEETGNIGIGNAAVKNIPALVGPVLQIGNDEEGASSGQLILSRHMLDGRGRSFKMGLADDFNFSIGDFGRSADKTQVYSPGLVINYYTSEVTLPKKLNLANGLLMTGDGKIVFRTSADSDIGIANVPDLGLYSTIEKHNMRFAVNQAAIAFFNNKSGETIADGKVSLVIDQDGNVGVGNADSLNVIKSGTDPVLQIGNDGSGDNSGQLILSKHRKSDGGSRSFKVGLDENFAFSIGDFDHCYSERTYTPALTIDYLQKNVSVHQSLFVTGNIVGKNGLTLKNNGGIRLVDPQVTDTINSECTDLGLYSAVKEKWIRIATNQAPITFFNNKEGEKEYGVLPSMVIDTNRNVGIGIGDTTNVVAVGSDSVLQIGNDRNGDKGGHLILGKCLPGGAARSFKMGLDDNFAFSLGDYSGHPNRTYIPALTVDWQKKDVTILQSLFVKGTVRGNHGITLKNNAAIRLANPDEADNVQGIHTDLGLYSTVPHNLIRIAANQAPIAFFNNKAGEAEYGIFPSMLIDANRNVGIGTDHVLSSTAENGPILQIGNDDKSLSDGQLLISRFSAGDQNRTYKMCIDDKFNFIIGDYGWKDQNPRTYEPAIVISANNQNVEIKKTLTVVGQSVTGSDSRIKKDIVSCDSAKSLDILTKLNIADYKHIDPSTFGDKFVKGVIAQQVEAVFPEAVVTGENYLPNILAAPNAIIETEGMVTFTMAQPHLLVDGDVVKIRTQSGDKQPTVTIIDEHRFSVQGVANDYQNYAIVVGKQVNDFKSIDYNRLFILNLSATQQLAKENKEIKQQLMQTMSELEKYRLQWKD